MIPQALILQMIPVVRTAIPQARIVIAVAVRVQLISQRNVKMLEKNLIIEKATLSTIVIMKGVIESIEKHNNAAIP